MPSIHRFAPSTQASENPGKPPLSAATSFPSQLFEYGSGLYWQFIQALLDGLDDYERREGGSSHASSPLPAA
jgi:hypothetical protein